jgi:hypothetical protein
MLLLCMDVVQVTFDESIFLLRAAACTDNPNALCDPWNFGATTVLA